MAKVHEVVPLEPATEKCSERLLLQMLDSKGNLRKATAWPLLCHWDLCMVNTVVTIIGCTASMKCNSLSLGSDCCVARDEILPPEQFPAEMFGTKWHRSCFDQRTMLLANWSSQWLAFVRLVLSIRMQSLGLQFCFCSSRTTLVNCRH